MAVGYRTESMHGAGSPQAQRIMIARQGNIEAKKELAKAIAKYAILFKCENSAVHIKVMQEF